jgi:hypothetical protein
MHPTRRTGLSDYIHGDYVYIQILTLFQIHFRIILQVIPVHQLLGNFCTVSNELMYVLHVALQHISHSQAFDVFCSIKCHTPYVPI